MILSPVVHLRPAEPAAADLLARRGFQIVGRRMFDQDDCLVMRLDRDDNGSSAPRSKT